MQRPLIKLATAAALVCSLPTAMAGVLTGQEQSARLLTALALIVPQPYEISVDNSIPTDTRLSWGEQGDWEQQLRQAAESAGLGVHFNDSGHSLLIFRLPRIHRVSFGSNAQAQGGATGQEDLGAMAGGAWSATAPAMPHQTMRLIDAVQTLIPPSLATKLQLEILATDLNAPTHWGAGSRWDALRTMLHRMGLQVRLDGKNLRIAPMGNADSGGDAQIQPSGAQRQGAATVVADSAGSVPMFQPTPMWTLEANQTIGAGLSAWAKAAGWVVVWGLPEDWRVPNAAQFQGNFKSAATQVIQALAANGAAIRATLYQGNKTLVVTSAGDVRK